MSYETSSLASKPEGFNANTPLGGGIGSSDFKRPSLQELGIEILLHRSIITMAVGNVKRIYRLSKIHPLRIHTDQ